MTNLFKQIGLTTPLAIVAGCFPGATRVSQLKGISSNLYPHGPYDLKPSQPEAFVVNQENTVRTAALNELLAALKPVVAGPELSFLEGDILAPTHLDCAARSSDHRPLSTTFAITPPAALNTTASSTPGGVR